MGGTYSLCNFTGLYHCLCEMNEKCKFVCNIVEIIIDMLWVAGMCRWQDNPVYEWLGVMIWKGSRYAICDACLW